MFKETFGNVTLETVSEAKRGLCLQASMENGERILMDICGMAIPDGTNVYFFGNKLLVVTRWADMSDAEKDRTQNGDIVLAIHPSELMQFSMKLGPHWGDVMLTLPHCYTPYNDEKAPVDQIIFVFTDKYDTDFLIARAVALPPFLQKRFQKALATSHEMIDLDEAMPTLLANSRTNETKDVWDLVYDVCWRVIAPYDREARSKNFEVEDGLYVEINGDNEIVNVEQHEVKAEPEMSDEVKLYLQLAQNGYAEGAYNLGVCYEQGDGVEQDFEKAVYWYTQAAEKGYDKAQYNLGVCYTNGYGVEQDNEEAIRLYKLAAEQGNMYARFNLAVCYMQGIGVEPDVFVALEYMQQAAEQGHPTAREFLGMD
ncbi:MAG: sel1 repeat family protein [Clostridia bacterium]|nr:sel1 repeat family protein [Clostridia bacterium]